MTVQIPKRNIGKKQAAHIKFGKGMLKLDGDLGYDELMMTRV